LGSTVISYTQVENNKFISLKNMEKQGKKRKKSQKKNPFCDFLKLFQSKLKNNQQSL
jgi:hypothetical protein